MIERPKNYRPRRTPASPERNTTPKRVEKRSRIIRDPQRFAEYITKRDRKLLDRLEEYDRQGKA